jgi:tetratricopeptide (TPR) repeat protein
MEENNYTIRGNASQGILEKISFLILFAVAFLVPIFFLPVSFISVQFGTSLLFGFGVIVATLVYIVLALVSGSVDMPKPIKTLISVFVVVPVFYILAGIANGFYRMAFLGYTFDISTVGFIVLGFIFMFLVSLLFKNKERIFYSYLSFLVASLLVFLFVVLRMIFGVKFMSFGLFDQITSTVIGSWNNISIFFGVCAILSLITYEMLNVSRVIKVLLSLAILASLFFLALVNFGSVWIIMAICSMLFIVYSVSNKQSDVVISSTWKEKILRIPLYSALFFIISVVFAVSGSSIGGYLSNKLNISNFEVRPSLSLTLEITRNTLKSHPLFGSGPNTFATQWQSFRPDSITTTDFWDTNFAYGIGLIPTFAVTTGILGVLSWLLFFGFYIYFGIKFIFVRVEDQFMKYLIVSSFFASIFLWIMAWIYIPSTVIFILSFFFTGLFFASLYITNLIPLTPYTFSYNPKVGFVSSLVLVTIFFGVSALGFGLYKNSKSLWYFQKSSYALNTSGDITGSEGYMLKAIETVPYDVYYRALTEIRLAKLNAIASQDQKQTKLEDIQKQFSDALPDTISAGKAAVNADSKNYLNWISLGRIYETLVPYKIEGAYNSAQGAYTEALRYNPKNPGIMMLFARLAVANNDIKSARNFVMQAIQAKNNYLDAYFLLSQIEVADNNLRGAIDSVTAASIIDPTNSAVFFQLGLLKYNLKDFNGAIEALEKSIKLVPDYANAKYFLGLSYESVGEHEKAITQFTELKTTNPDNKELDAILENLVAGKPIFTDAKETKPEKASQLPVKEQR